jgi:hypothetical protein
MGCGGMTMVRVAAWLCQPITGRHLKAAQELRDASAALGEKLWHPVLWMCLGGSVRGYAAQWSVGTHRATELVKDGLARLGDHFYGSPTPRVRPTELLRRLRAAKTLNSFWMGVDGVEGGFPHRYAREKSFL